MNKGDNQNLLGSPVVKSKSPILFIIFTLLLLIDGVFTILGSFPALLIGGILAGGIFIIIGVGKIIVAIGLRKMKNWALYGLTIIVILMITPLFRDQKDLMTIITRIYEIIILVYFWHIFKKQVSKIWILAILITLIAGEFFIWQYFGAPKEEVKLSDAIQNTVVDWQIYYNERYGIEFKYPKLWVLDEKSSLAAGHPDQNRNFIQINVSNGVRSPEDESMSPCQQGIAALVFQVGKLRESQQTFEEFVNFQIENPERGKPPSVKPELIQTTVGGHNAFVIKNIYDSCEKDFYYIEQNSSRYTTISFIVDKNEDKLVINQILSTFRFLD